jgi:hypothetical protein
VLYRAAWAHDTKILLRVCALVILTLLTVACRDLVDEGAGPDTGLSQAPPAVEGTGPERPAPARKGQPTINLPLLPYGSNGQTTFESSSPAEFEMHCVPVEWLGDPIPPGITIEVTDIQITPSGVFMHPPGGACGKNECHSTKVHLTFRTVSESRCSVAVQPVGYGKANLILKGRATCAAGNQKLCNDFAAAAKGQAKPIVLRSDSLDPGAEEPTEPESQPEAPPAPTTTTG